MEKPKARDASSISIISLSFKSNEQLLTARCEYIVYVDCLSNRVGAQIIRGT